MREKLIDLIEKADKAQEERSHRTMRDFYGDIADFLIEHCVVVLPCKVGDTIYSIWEDDDEGWKIDETEVFDVSTKRIYINGGDYSVECLGKTDFLTREEAEKACGLRGAKDEADV